MTGYEKCGHLGLLRGFDGLEVVNRCVGVMGMHRFVLMGRYDLGNCSLR